MGLFKRTTKEDLKKEGKLLEVPEVPKAPGYVEMPQPPRPQSIKPEITNESIMQGLELMYKESADAWNTISQNQIHLANQVMRLSEAVNTLTDLIANELKK